VADVLIRPSEPGDAVQLHANLRPADRAECDAYGHDDLAASLESNIRRSVLCWTGLVDGELAAVIGVTPINLLAGVGSPWMLGTPVLDRHQRVLIRRTPDYIASMLQVFPHLVNFVHARNLTSVRWLARLGFAVYPPVPYGPRGELFHPFEMRA
jgi:hypothetical protein